MRRVAIMLGVCAAAAVSFAARAAPAFDLATLLNNPREPAPLKLIHVVDLSAMMKDSPLRVRIYDANLPQVRAAYGLIPGAHPLSSSDGYDVEATLPRDRNAKLVFYCWNGR